MVSCQLLGLCVMLMAGLTSAYHFSSTLPAGAQLGDTCTPASGRLSRCGNKTLISENVTELTEEDGFSGPNVCRTTKEYTTQTCGYTYQSICYRARFGRSCFTQCAATKECNGTMINFTKSSISCCEGFAQGESPETSASEEDFSHYYRRRHGRRSSLRTEGCPVVLEESVLDCLVKLNLNEFLAELVQVEDLLTRLSDPESKDVTIFAPSDDAIINLDDILRARLFSDETRATTVGGHVVDGLILEKHLFHSGIVNTLANNISLHVGQVRNGTTKLSFVNGVFISEANACQARNGIVHVVDNVIPSSSATIDDILTELSDRFSTFKQLLDASGISKQLDKPGKSRTLFAPTNDAFDQLPSGAVECLLRESNSHYLSKFVLIHISLPAEFTPTLSQRKYVPTFTYWYLVVSMSDEGGVLITRDEIPIEDPDLPARNGVIHVIPEAIVPSRIDFERLCPDIATTSAPEPMTTEPITTVNVVDPTGPTDLPEGPGELVEGGGVVGE